MASLNSEYTEIYTGTRSLELKQDRFDKLCDKILAHIDIATDLIEHKGCRIRFTPDDAFFESHAIVHKIDYQFNSNMENLDGSFLNHFNFIKELLQDLYTTFALPSEAIDTFINKSIIVNNKEFIYDNYELDFSDGYIMEGKTKMCKRIARRNQNVFVEQDYIFRQKFFNGKCMLDYPQMMVPLHIICMLMYPVEGLDMDSHSLFVERFPLSCCLLDGYNYKHVNLVMSIYCAIFRQTQLCGSLHLFINTRPVIPFKDTRDFECKYITTDYDYISFATRYYMSYVMMMEVLNESFDLAKFGMSAEWDCSLCLLAKTIFPSISLFFPNLLQDVLSSQVRCTSRSRSTWIRTILANELAEDHAPDSPKYQCRLSYLLDNPALQLDWKVDRNKFAQLLSVFISPVGKTQSGYIGRYCFDQIAASKLPTDEVFFALDRDSIHVLFHQDVEEMHGTKTISYDGFFRGQFSDKTEYVIPHVSSGKHLIVYYKSHVEIHFFLTSAAMANYITTFRIKHDKTENVILGNNVNEWYINYYMTSSIGNLKI